jgi:hypothetical protein
MMTTSKNVRPAKIKIDGVIATMLQLLCKSFSTPLQSLFDEFNLSITLLEDGHVFASFHPSSFRGCPLLASHTACLKARDLALGRLASYEHSFRTM